MSDKNMNQIETKITKIMFMSGIKTSAIVDKTSSWFLGGVAATSALFISNIESISNLLGSETTRIMILLLIISIVFGFLQKYLATQLSINVAVTETVEPIIEEAVAQGLEADFVKIVDEIKKIVPWYQKKKALQAFEQSTKDPLFGHKTSARMYNRQVVYALLQVFVALLVLAIAAMNINNI